MYYQEENVVKVYQCDVNNRMKISAAMQQMQQAASEQLERLGLPYEKLLEEEMVFLLSKICIKVHRMPVLGEHVLTGTAPVRTQGARFVREFVIDAPGGDRLLSAVSLWLLLNPNTRKVLRPQSFPYALPFRNSVVEKVIGNVTLPKPADGEEGLRTEMAVRYSHIDCNHHVNNSVYGDFVCDALPYGELVEKGLDTLVISFLSEARWGETLALTTLGLSAGSYHISGVKEDRPCFEAFVQLREIALARRE